MRSGWRLFLRMPVPSIAYASIAVIAGLGLLFGVGKLGVSPMSLPLAGGFMLLAPVMLSGFFRLAESAEAGQKPSLLTPFVAFLHAPLQIWMVAVFCAFIFLIWVTDAGVLYSFIIGGSYQPSWLLSAEQDILRFWFWGALMGAVLAFIIFCVSAFSVPLLHQGRGTLVQAVHASVRAVFINFIPCMSWAAMLTLSILMAILILPLLLVVLPSMAYASYRLYQKVFPVEASDRDSR